jgi:acyl carrier protein
MQIKNIIIKELNLEDLDGKTRIKDLVEDSLEMVELLFAIETATGKRLTDADIFQAADFDQLIDILEKK